MPSYRYPDHWYHDQLRIHCIVPQCDFITPSTTVGNQWDELCDHCEGTLCADHKILQKMLFQSLCAIDNCDEFVYAGAYHLGLRALLNHEKLAHGSTDMSNICSFVRLAREGRICNGVGRHPTPGCEEAAFHRMLGKVSALPAATLDLLFEKSGYHNPDEKHYENLKKILTEDPLAQAGEHPPFWWPIRAEHFLERSRPQPSDPPDPHWNSIWTRLREEYADGRI